MSGVGRVGTTPRATLQKLPSEASPFSQAGLPDNPLEGPLGTLGAQATPQAGESVRIRGVIGGWGGPWGPR